MKINVLFVIILVLFSVSCTDRLYEVKETRDMMGTFVTITVHDAEKELAKSAVKDAFTEIDRIEQLLSEYINSSEVSYINRNGIIRKPSADFMINIEKAIQYGTLSDGAFDITVQPILDLYSESFNVYNRAPTAQDIQDILSKVDYRQIQIEGDVVRIGDGQKITFGGLAKGYAVDKAIEVLSSEGISNAVVNAGGDLKAIGKRFGNQYWSVALVNPRDKEDYITVIELSNEAVVTSGDYERYFDEEKKFHHIVNPITGYSATELISVTIKADNAFDADAISTAVFVLGERKGLELIENLDNVEGLIITSNKEILRSSGFS